MMTSKLACAGRRILKQFEAWPDSDTIQTRSRSRETSCPAKSRIRFFVFVFAFVRTCIVNSTMTPKIETQPFLGYYDDPAQPPSEDTLAEARRTARGHKLAGDLLVFLLASLLWLAAIFLLLPRPPAAPAEHGDSSCGSAAAAAATHARAQAQATAKGDFRVHNVTSGSSFVSCGNSTAEARRAGCQYDTLLTHWVPARCADQEWVDEYQDDDSWMAFAEYVLFIYITQPSPPPSPRLNPRFSPRARLTRTKIIIIIIIIQQREPHAAAVARGNGPAGSLLHLDPRPRQPLRDAVAEAVLDAVQGAEGVRRRDREHVPHGALRPVPERSHDDEPDDADAGAGRLLGVLGSR